MKNNSQILIKFFIVSAFLASIANPVFADSRSASIKVSCTILPMLEMSLPTPVAAPMTVAQKPEAGIELKSEGSLIHINTNLGKDYQLMESWVKYDNNRTRLYSIIAL